MFIVDGQSREKGKHIFSAWTEHEKNKRENMFTMYGPGK